MQPATHTATHTVTNTATHIATPSVALANDPSQTCDDARPTQSTPEPLAFFVTGTDTEIGKTFVSAGLIRAWVRQGHRAVGMKPIAAGAERGADGQWHNEDVDQLFDAGNVDAPLALRCPALFQAACAPHVAAALEGRPIQIDALLEAFKHLRPQAQRLIVEGVGGFEVPLNEQHSSADLAQALGLPVVMVVGLRLGCINHALLTAQAIAARGLKLAGWVANTVDPIMAHPQGSIDALRQRLGAPLLAVIPRVAQPGPDAAADHLAQAAKELAERFPA